MVIRAQANELKFIGATRRMLHPAALIHFSVIISAAYLRLRGMIFVSPCRSGNMCVRKE